MSGRRVNGVQPTSSFKRDRRAQTVAPPSSFKRDRRNEETSTAASSNTGNVTASSSSGQTVRSNARKPASSRDATGNKDDKKSFNPKLIFSQILALQCFHYVFLGLLFEINSLFFGRSITIDRIFTDKYLQMWSSKGLPDTFAVLLSSIVGAVLLAVIVEKSKKCLDFSFTLFLIHLCFCTVYDGMPSTWDWWIVNIMGTIIMILLGEYVCSLREMKEIPLLEM